MSDDDEVMVSSPTPKTPPPPPRPTQSLWQRLTSPTPAKAVEPPITPPSLPPSQPSPPKEEPTKVTKSTTHDATITTKGKSLTWQSTHLPNSFYPALGVTIWIGGIGFVSSLAISTLFIRSPYYRAGVLGFMIIGAMLPLPKSQEDGHKLGFRLGNFCMAQAAYYFGLKLFIPDTKVFDSSVRKSGLIIALEPHDVLPYSLFAFTSCLNIIPGNQNLYGLMTSAVFLIPLVRHIYTYCSAGPVDKKTFRKHLLDNHAVAFTPGGVQEVFLLDPSKPNEIVLFLESRKGFIKLALETGSPIIPAFTFNLDGSYTTAMLRGSLAKRIGKIIGFVPMLFFGRHGIPLGIPYPVPIRVVLGDTVAVEKCEEPSKEMIEEVHGRFIKAMVEVFERHKVENGYGEKVLKIV